MSAVETCIGKIVWQGKVVGTGFLAHKSGLIATCYHVVKVAGDPPTDAVFSFQPITRSQSLDAIVTHRVDPQNDIALLKIRGIIPEGMQPAVLIPSARAKAGSLFHVTGYGKIDDHPVHVYDYSSAAGTVVGPIVRDGVELLQIESKQILQGMSGAPIFIEALGGAVGMISGRYSIDPAHQTWMRDTAWAVRSEFLDALLGSAKRDFFNSGGVFLSYKREDQDMVTRFYKDLKLRGITRIWMDLTDIRLGQQWEREIEKAITGCTQLVVFISPQTLESEVVKYEYELAHSLGKEIIPVFLHSIEIPTLPELLRKYQIGLNVEHDGYQTTLLRLAKVLPRFYIKPQMVSVPGGHFTMGHPNSQTEFDLPSFWISKTSITVAEYACFLKAYGYEAREYWIADTLEKWRHGPRESIWGRSHLEDFAHECPHQPMRGITWYEALAYCNWLTYITNHPFSLPSEAQWEKAARGTDGRKWAAGNTWQPSVGDVNDSITPRLDPKDCGMVGSESPYGCQDMMGHIWNWTLSLDLRPPYLNNGKAEALDDLDQPRVIRGGSWMHGTSKAVTYHRESQSPIPEDYRYEIGFRVITDKDPSYLYEEGI